MTEDLTLNECIYAVVQQIPPGVVATYGQIAAIVGPPVDARIVGYALAALGPLAASVPWQRVINAQGKISTREVQQRWLLEAEGVEFDDKGKTDLDRFGWEGPDPEWCKAQGFRSIPSGMRPGRGFGQRTLF